MPPATEGGLLSSGYRRTLQSFDRGVKASGTVYRPERYAAFDGPALEARSMIARGAGLSYAAGSFREGGDTVDMKCFDRILAFDLETGEVEAEAGITMASLQDFLSAHGRYLPVQPGHGQITLGGCIGADIHGKNQAVDGNFSASVTAIGLFHPEVGTRRITATSAPDLFAATCGGYGLTGIIVAARLTTRRLPGNALFVRAIAVANPVEGAEVMRAETGRSDVVYSWHDFTNADGRGLVFAGRFVADGATDRPAARLRTRPSPDLRSVFPLRLHGAWTTPLLNAAYYVLSRRRGPDKRLGLREAMFPMEGREAYFRGFGPRGFHEYQAIVPDDRFADYIGEARRLAKRHEITITLASGKAFGGESRLLRFAGKGICFALNIPRTAGSPAMLGELDRVLMASGGRPNLIKDSRLPQAVVQACCPEYDRFCDLVRQADPSRRFRSELSDRLGL